MSGRACGSALDEHLQAIFTEFWLVHWHTLDGSCAARCLHCLLAGGLSARRSHWGAQVCHICGGERGRAQAAHLLRVPPGALLRAALPAGGLGCPPSSVQAAASGLVVGSLDYCASWGMTWD